LVVWVGPSALYYVRPDTPVNQPEADVMGDVFEGKKRGEGRQSADGATAFRVVDEIRC